METQDFSEDDQILARLENEADVEAFSNLMAHAHDLGMSAADFVREEPKRTSRRCIRKLCLKNRKRSLYLMVSSVMKSLWDRPAKNPEEAFVHTLYGPPRRPDTPDTNGHNGRMGRD